MYGIENEQLHISKYGYGAAARGKTVAVEDRYAHDGAAATVKRLAPQAWIGIPAASGNGERRCCTGWRRGRATYYVLALIQPISVRVDQYLSCRCGWSDLLAIRCIERTVAGEHCRGTLFNSSFQILGAALPGKGQQIPLAGSCLRVKRPRLAHCPTSGWRRSVVDTRVHNCSVIVWVEEIGLGFTPDRWAVRIGFAIYCRHKMNRVAIRHDRSRVLARE